MPDAILVNPASAYDVPADFTTNRNKFGVPIEYPQKVEIFQSSGAILVGDCVEFVAPTTTAPVRVKKFANADLGHMFVGVSLDAAAASGVMVRIVVLGMVLVNVGAATPAATNLAIKSGTDGQAAVSGTVDATLVVGTVIGTFLQAKDANNQALLWVSPR